MKEYRIGIVGAGMMGKTHAWCWRSMPFFYEGLDFRVRLHGVCTSRLETARAARDAYGFERAYASVGELIESDEVDVVDIASPNHCHLEAVLAASRLGKPVYCDKPLTGNLAEALAIEREVANPSRAGQMVFHNRFLPATMRARAMVESGDLGEIIAFRAAYLHSGNVPPGKRLAWKDLRSHGAGVLYDLGSHLADLVTWVCGDAIAEVHARQKTLHARRPSYEDPNVLVEQDTDDMTLMSVVTRNGALGVLEASKIATGAQDDLRLEIHGTNGAIRFSLMDPNYLDWFDQRDPEAPLGGESGFKRLHCVRRYPAPAGFPSPKAAIGWLRGHLHCAYSFVSALHEGREFDPSLGRGIEIERVLAAVQRSADAGTSVRLDG